MTAIVYWLSLKYKDEDPWVLVYVGAILGDFFMWVAVLEIFRYIYT